MKSELSISLVPFLFLTATASALTPVSDDFNAASLNANRWIYQKGGKGTLTQAAGLLNYKAALPITNDDFAILTLRNNQPGYNENWQIILDVSNTANAGEKVGVGISIHNSADRTDNVNLEFYGAGARGGFNFIGVTNDMDDPSQDVRAFPNVTKGSIRVTFNAATKLFTFWYDTTGSANGFQWVQLCTFSPTGKGGTRRGNWNMNPAGGTFGVQIFGYSEAAVANGKASMDNFKLMAGK
jgi:hypothetical protein